MKGWELPVSTNRQRKRTAGLKLAHDVLGSRKIDRTHDLELLYKTKHSYGHSQGRLCRGHHVNSNGISQVTSADVIMPVLAPGPPHGARGVPAGGHGCERCANAAAASHRVRAVAAAGPPGRQRICLRPHVPRRLRGESAPGCLHLPFLHFQGLGFRHLSGCSTLQLLLMAVPALTTLY